MARLALALALCFVGAAHGLGGTTNPVCSDVKLYPGNVFASASDCDDKLAGESCDYRRDEDDEVEGVCLLTIVEGDIGVMKCSCCRDGGEGLAPEGNLGIEPGTVLPQC